MDARKEIVVLVNDKNEETGTASRAEMRAGNLIHRATYIMVFNRSGELFVQKRTMQKDIYPGYYEIAAGGVVLAGESYEESARRELQEELGVTSDTLTCHFDHFHDDGSNRVWGRVYSCTAQGPFDLQKEEVESGKFMSLNRTLTLTGKLPFCPDGVDILHRYIRENTSHPSG